MRKLMDFFIVFLFLFLTSGMIPGAVSNDARAQSLQGMSCYDLWYERNRIFAAQGYCFKTRKAQNVFGRSCFPPYGRLSSGEQRRVDDIKQQERYMGCSRGSQAAPPPPSQPQYSSYSSMSCNQLWRERNSIFARNGHCFKTSRGQNAFGRGCFPPYGKLGRADRREVNTILSWESRRGCR